MNEYTQQTPVSGKEIASDMSKAVQDVKTFASERINQGKAAVGDYAHRAKQQMDEYRLVASEKASAMRHASEDMIRDNPWKAIGSVLVIGVVLGVLFSGRRT